MREWGGCTNLHLPLQSHASLHHLIEHIHTQHNARDGQAARDVCAQVQVLNEWRQVVRLLKVLWLCQPLDDLLHTKVNDVNDKHADVLVMAD